jgi:ribosomal-protein-alanine N-acetyltransferase
MSSYAAESQRLWLQPLSVEDHLDDYHEMLGKEDVMAWSCVSISSSHHLTYMNSPFTFSTRKGPPHKTVEETLTLMNNTCVASNPGNNVRHKMYAILLKPVVKLTVNGERDWKPKMIGVIGTPRKDELAYNLHSSYWGKGYMSEALKVFLDLYFSSKSPSFISASNLAFFGEDFAKEIAQNFTVPEDQFIRAYADPENLASLRVLEKAGFREVRRYDQHYKRASLGGTRKSDLICFLLEKHPVV